VPPPAGVRALDPAPASVAVPRSGRVIGIDASRAFRYPQTGTEVYSEQLIRGLMRQESAHRFLLYVNRAEAPDWDVPAGFEWRCLPQQRLWTQMRLSREMWRRPVDALFVPSHVLPAVHPPVSMVTVHDVGFLFHRDAYRRSQWLYLNWSTAWMSRAANALLADSEATRDDLVRYYRADPSRIHVVYLACSEAYRARGGEEVAAIRARHELPERYMLASGTLQRRKNLPFLVEAFGRVAGGVPDTLVIAGKDGPDRIRVEHRIAQLGLQNRVRLIGSVPQSDMPALLTGARALLFPSLYEGFGMPAVEAMACGTPVLAARTSSLTEIVGGFGLLADPDDIDAWARLIRELAHEDRGHSILRAQGLRRAAEFSWDRSARRVLDILDTLLPS
jgi:glycosyltransferase involved in cell wall biosynthesis